MVPGIAMRRFLCIAVILPMLFSGISGTMSVVHSASHSSGNSQYFVFGQSAGNGSSDSHSSRSGITPNMFPRPPGGGGSTTVQVTLYIFDSAGQIEINGSSYSNGTTVSLISGGWYNINAVNINSGYTFYKWITDSNGYISDQNSGTTVFYPSNTGSLTMVIQGPNTNWGGLEVSGKGFNSVSTSITLPSSVEYPYWVNGYNQQITWGTCTTTEEVGFWTGLGGMTGNLWQAGIAIRQNSSSSTPWVYAWYEYVGLPGTPSSYTILPVPLYGIHVTLGDQVEVSIKVGGVGGQEVGYYTFTDDSVTQQTISGSVALPPNFFVNYPVSAEWVTEAPGIVALNFNSVLFSGFQTSFSSGSSYSYLYAPLATGVGMENFYYGLSYLHQYFTPYTGNFYLSGFYVNYSEQEGYD